MTSKRRPSPAPRPRGPLADRVRLVTAVVAVGTLASLGLAPRLFLRHPIFTPVPVVAGLALPSPLDLVVLVALGALLPVILIPRRPWALVLVWCALFAARAVWDESTWQPYYYQYFFMLLLLAVAAWRGDDATALEVSRLVLASIYLWSGLHKLHYDFLHSGIATVFPRLAPLVPAVAAPWIALAMASLETAIGPGLLIRRTRRLAMVTAIVMHAGLLAAIGPWGQNHNRIVWPWNVAMIVLLVVLFHREDAPVFAPRVSPRAWAARGIVLVFFVLGPLSSFAGLWPSYLAFKLYSLSIHTGTIFVTRPVADALTPAARGALVPAAVGPYVGYLPVLAWSERELGAMLPPEPAVFKEVARRLCPLAPRPKDIMLVIEDPPARWTGAIERSAVWCAKGGEGPGVTR